MFAHPDLENIGYDRRVQIIIIVYVLKASGFLDASEIVELLGELSIQGIPNKWLFYIKTLKWATLVCQDLKSKNSTSLNLEVSTLLFFFQ